MTQGNFRNDKAKITTQEISIAFFYCIKIVNCLGFNKKITDTKQKETITHFIVVNVIKYAP